MGDADGVAGQPRQVCGDAPDAVTGQIGDPQGRCAERVDRQPGRAHGLGLGNVGQRAEIRRLALEVDHVLSQLDAADAIGQRVVDLHHQGGPPPGQPLHQGELPEGTGGVEGGHARHAGQPDDGVQGVRRRRRHPPHVPAEVEVVVRHPPHRTEPQRRAGQHRAEGRGEAGRPLDAVDEHVPIRGRVQQGDDNDRRPQQRVVLHVEREGIGLSDQRLERPGHGTSATDGYPVNVLRPPAAVPGRLSQLHRATGSDRQAAAFPAPSRGPR